MKFLHKLIGLILFFLFCFNIYSCDSFQSTDTRLDYLKERIENANKNLQELTQDENDEIGYDLVELAEYCSEGSCSQEQQRKIFFLAGKYIKLQFNLSSYQMFTDLSKLEALISGFRN